MYSFCNLFTSFRLDLNKNIQNDWKLYFSPQLDTYVYPLIRSQKCQNNKGSKKDEVKGNKEINIAKGTTDPGVDCFDQ